MLTKNVHNTTVRTWCDSICLVISYIPMFFAFGLITFAVFPYMHLYLPSLYQAYSYRVPAYAFSPADPVMEGGGGGSSSWNSTIPEVPTTMVPPNTSSLPSSSSVMYTTSPTPTLSSIHPSPPTQGVKKQKKDTGPKKDTYRGFFSLIYGSSSHRSSSLDMEDESAIQAHSGVSTFFLLYCLLGFTLSATSLYWNFFKSVFTSPGYVSAHPWHQPPRLLLPDESVSPPPHGCRATIKKHGKMVPMRDRTLRCFTPPPPPPLASLATDPTTSSPRPLADAAADTYSAPSNPFLVTQTTSSGDVRFCRHCHLYKPDDAHHCRSCRRCVYMMDHHCPFVNNCVGRDNMKYFLLFTVSIPLTAFHITSTMLYSVVFREPQHLAFVSCFSDRTLGFIYYFASIFMVVVFFLAFGGFSARFWCLYARGETSMSEMIRIRTTSSGSAPMCSDECIQQWMRTKVEKLKFLSPTKRETRLHAKKRDVTRAMGSRAEELAKAKEETTEEETEDEIQTRKSRTSAEFQCISHPLDDDGDNNGKRTETIARSPYSPQKKDNKEEDDEKERWKNALPGSSVDDLVSAVDASRVWPPSPLSQVYHLPYTHYFASPKAAHRYMIFGEETRWWARLLPFAPIRNPDFLYLLDTSTAPTASCEYAKETSEIGCGA